MTQKDKDLLLKDLCARIPYEVKGSTKVGGNIKISFIGENTIIGEDGDSYDISFITPYLFPFSSMTEEQKKEYESLCIKETSEYSDLYGIIFAKDHYYDTIESIDYLYKNHIDVRGLIPLGLAIDCTNLNIY